MTVINGGDGNDTIRGQDGDDILNGGDGRDTLSGEGGNDTLRGGAGADHLSGGAGNDTYLFGAGDGNTTIDNRDTAAERTDVLRFLEGIAASDVTAGRGWYANDLRLTIGAVPVKSLRCIATTFAAMGRAVMRWTRLSLPMAQAGMWIRSKRELLQGTDGNDFIIGFANDDVINGGDGDDKLYGKDGDDTLRGGAGNDRLHGEDSNDTLRGGAGSDSLYGGDGNDILRGGTGRDRLYGDDGNDTLRGGAGNGDYLVGGAGNDTYLFGAGDGNTTVGNYDIGAGRHDVLRFLEGIAASDVTASRDHGGNRNDLRLTIGSTGEVITVLNYFHGDGAGGRELNAIEFADGTSWDVDTVKAKVAMVLVLQGTGGNDNMTGFASDDVMNGGDGDDQLYGKDGKDTLLGGDGDDQLYGEDDNDILLGGDGDDQLYGEDGNDILLGGDGDDQLYGEDGNDTLRGGAGNDSLDGGAGNDTYEFGSGDGNTTINNYDTAAERTDVLRFLGIAVSDVTVSRSYNDLRLTIGRPSKVITVSNYFEGDGAGGYALNAIEFADGTSWDVDTVKAMVLQTTDGNDTIIGYASDDVINGGAGDDRLDGKDGNDTLRGGAGRDYLYGGAGNDTYLFGSGDGNTWVSNHDTGAGRHDVLRFLEGIAASDVTVSRAHRPRRNDLLLTIGSTGEVITVLRYFEGDGAGGYALNAIEFADGTSWDVDTVKAKVLQGTDGNDTIIGFASDDVINGGDGDDTIRGEDGDDTLNGGDGHDILSGGDGDDTLRGGAGSGDFLDGGAGNDTYLFGAGDGSTTIRNLDIAAERTDVLRFLEGIAASDVTVSRGHGWRTNDLRLTIGSPGEVIAVQSYFFRDGASVYVLNAIEFADGTSWDVDTVKAKVLQGTDGNDTIIGRFCQR